MEAYKLAVEMADRVSARRAVANAFFLTVNTTLVAVVGLRGTAASSALLTISVCLAGIAVAACWWFLLQNYRRLNEAKFVVINKIEADHLPVRVFSDEWAALGGPDALAGRVARAKAAFKQLGTVEKIVPVVFALLYVMLLIGRLVA
ncbi:RipA family octameric membrane protein [Microbacterium sp. JZ101]